MLQAEHDHDGRPPAMQQRLAIRKSRAIRRVLFGLPGLVLLLLATSCSSVSGAGSGFLAGPKPLSDAEQAAFRAANRELILEDITTPPGTSLTALGDTSNENDEDQVTAVTTNFRLSMPVSTPTVEAWRAAHPDHPGPSPELDAAFDADVYRPAWLKLDEVEKQLKRLGFRRETEPDTSSLVHRTVTLRRSNVTVWLGIEYPGGRVSVYRRS
jgi:hypothetical protein